MVLLGTKNKIIAVLSATLFLISCGEEENSVRPEKTTRTQPKIEIVVPPFNADSAYQYIQNQVDFGPRTNNSEAHKLCGNYFSSFFEEKGFTVYEQTGNVTGHDGKSLKFKNIIAQHNPNYGTRILVTAHWDTRPWADEDTERKNQPILGANDGGSGVGVIMELARIIAEKNPKVGVDFILWDAEDYGMPGVENSYCLGAQYWGNNLVPSNYRAKYGINLDMVGAKDAVFPIEGISKHFAPHIVSMVWRKAEKLGYQKFFPRIDGGQITDDHLYVNQLTGIPCIDIIHRDPTEGTFHSSWHTHDDNMSVIDKETLKAVGQTVLAVLYDEVIR
jgi:glutaminyl-peptide cyclotransferase